MSFVSYRCPRTSQEVTTGIDTDAEALAKLRTLKIAVACPHCPEGHSVPADEMFFSDTASSTPAPVCTEKLNSGVLVMKPADQGM